jgi:hypothetical protein
MLTNVPEDPDGHEILVGIVAARLGLQRTRLSCVLAGTGDARFDRLCHLRCDVMRMVGQLLVCAARASNRMRTCALEYSITSGTDFAMAKFWAKSKAAMTFPCATFISQAR